MPALGSALFLNKKMNKEKFATLDEIKILLRITGTDLDAAINMYLQAACNQICDLLDAYELMTFAITDEEVKVMNQNYLSPKYLPIDWTTPPTVKTTNGTTVSETMYRELGELRTIRRKDSNGNSLIFGNSHYKVSYTAGFATLEDVPTDLKMLAALMVQAQVLKVDGSSMGRLAGDANQTAGQIKKYKLGKKEVEYFDPNVKAGKSGFGAGIDFEATLNEWASKFKKFSGFA